ncbi:hypothetical protein [Nocardiopsis oceani]
MSTPDNKPSRKTNWPMIILIALVAIIAIQMCSARQAEQERIDRQNSLTCFINPNPIYCR